MENVIDNKVGSKRMFCRQVEGLGTLNLRPFVLEADLVTLHDWVNRPYASYWGLQNSSLEHVRTMYLDLLKIEDYQIYTGFHNGKMAFLMESYNPQYDVVAKHYPVQLGDRGMHILVGPPISPIKGFTKEIFSTVMEFLFADKMIHRVVVEPDVRNDKIHVLNKRAGFVYDRVIDLPNKSAYLAFCTREQYQQAKLKNIN